jgi:DNA-binding transcriptional LysR family regulator
MLIAPSTQPFAFTFTNDTQRAIGVPGAWAHRRRFHVCITENESRAFRTGAALSRLHSGRVAGSPRARLLAENQPREIGQRELGGPKSQQSTRISGRIQAALQKRMLSPRVVNEPGSMEAVLAMVAAGIGVSLAPSCISRFYQHRLAFIPIQPDPPRLDLVAARPDGDPPPTVAAFLDMLRQHLPQIQRKCAYRRPVLAG